MKYPATKSILRKINLLCMESPLKNNLADCKIRRYHYIFNCKNYKKWRVDDIRKANRMKNDVIRTGQIIYIPKED